MKRTQAISEYFAAIYLVGLFAAVGVATAITAVLALWPPLAWVAAKFFS